jgi:hypothetical protein
MRGPSDKDKDPDNVPPGGRAFQRIQQDRKARGLDPLPTPGTSGGASDQRGLKQDRAKTRKNK